MKTAKKFFDRVVNAFANMNTGQSKAAMSSFEDFNLSYVELESAYQDWLPGLIIDTPCQDMVRQWREITTPELEADKIKEYEAQEEDLNIKDKVLEGLKLGALYGGSVIVIGTDGTGDPATPLKMESIKPGSLKFLRVFDRHEIEVADNYTLNYLMSDEPEFYRINGTSQVIHKSRIVRFDGDYLPPRLRRQNNGWHQSKLKRPYDALKNAIESLGITQEMLQEAKIDIFRIPDLLDMSQTEEGTQALLNRFATANMSKSTNNATLMDADEEHQQKQINLANLDNVNQMLLGVAAAAASIPAVILLKKSPDGMNATGNSDIRIYRGEIRSKQENELKRKLRYLDKIQCMNLWGEIPDGWNFEFNSLDIPTPKEQADLEKTKAERDQIYLNLGVIDEIVVAKQLMNDNTYQAVTPDYIEDIEKAIAMAEKEAEAQRKKEADMRARGVSVENVPESMQEPDENQGAE